MQCLREEIAGTTVCVRLREVSVSGGSTVLSGLPKNANVKTEPNMKQGGHSESDMEP